MNSTEKPTLKQRKDGFIWLIVTDKAKEIFDSELFSIYALYEDETERLIYKRRELDEAMEKGLDIGIEVGFIK